MIKSMTGYGRAEAVQDGKKWVVEVKSLNHRFLEIFVRLPASLQPLEGEVKKKVGEKLSRGRIEVGVKADSDADQVGAMIDLNMPMIRHYHSLLSRMKEALGLRDEITIGMLTGFKDAFIYPEVEVNLEAAWAALEGVLDGALDALTAMREKEGEVICRDFDRRMDAIGRSLDVIASRVPQVVTEYHKKLSDRVKELLCSAEIDESRVSQEVAIMADRMDITEEIVRFKSHMDQFAEMLKSGEAVGRKLDFLLQEMNREVNTIGSKSNDAEISRQVVEIKSELSRLREQVQNIE
ncbi:MAG: YicC family protein [Syntrophobacterales bacterium]|nr:YicC family protein [Syntrophobacterales bacterium]